MPEAVVDSPETIEIDEEGGDVPAFALRRCQRVAQTLLVRCPVPQAGETVVVRQGTHLVEHAGVGERYGHLVGEPASLEQILRASLGPGDDPEPEQATALLLGGEREHDEAVEAERRQGLEVRRLPLGRAELEDLGHRRQLPGLRNRNLDPAWDRGGPRCVRLHPPHGRRVPALRQEDHARG